MCWRTMWYQCSAFLCSHPASPYERWHCCWPPKNRCPCDKLCTCLHKKAPGRRRRPPTVALSTFFHPQAGFCPSVEPLGGYNRTVWVSERARVSAGAHDADSYCLCSLQHRRPGAGNMPPPIKSDEVIKHKSRLFIMPANCMTFYKSSMIMNDQKVDIRLVSWLALNHPDPVVNFRFPHVFIHLSY